MKNFRSGKFKVSIFFDELVAVAVRDILFKFFAHYCMDLDK